MAAPSAGARRDPTGAPSAHVYERNHDDCNPFSSVALSGLQELLYRPRDGPSTRRVSDPGQLYSLGGTDATGLDPTARLLSVLQRPVQWSVLRGLHSPEGVSQSPHRASQGF